MHAVRMHAPNALDLSVRALGLEPLDRKALTRVNGGGYLAAGCLIGMSIGGVFFACAIIGASYYVYTHLR